MSGHRISGIQMQVTQDISENEIKIAKALARAAQDRAHFLHTPEGALSGYYPDFDQLQVEDAERRLVDMAAKAGVGLALGTCYKQKVDRAEYVYNQVRVYDPQGQYLGYQAKILRCSSLAYPGSGEMADYIEGLPRVFNWKNVQFGVLICNDMWATPGHTTMPNPYLPWKLKTMGAGFILHAINSGVDARYRAYHEACVTLWAMKLGMCIVGVNAAPGTGNTRVNALSGPIGCDGLRLQSVPDAGEQYFVCDIEDARLC